MNMKTIVDKAKSDGHDLNDAVVAGLRAIVYDLEHVLEIGKVLPAPAGVSLARAIEELRYAVEMIETHPRQIDDSASRDVFDGDKTPSAPALSLVGDA